MRGLKSVISESVLLIRWVLKCQKLGVGIVLHIVIDIKRLEIKVQKKIYFLEIITNAVGASCVL